MRQRSQKSPLLVDGQEGSRIVTRCIDLILKDKSELVWVRTKTGISRYKCDEL